MAKYTGTISAQNTSVYLCDVVRPHNQPYWYASICVGTAAGNTFGTGTVTIQGSTDGGTTKFTIMNMAGTAASFTAAGMLNVALGGPSSNIDTEQLKLYATIGAATNPALAVAVFDNR